MTSQSKTTSGPGQSESAAESTADTARGAAPLDRSSAEWRSQFGVLPSAYQQSGAARPAPAQGRRIVPPASPVSDTQKRSPAAFIAGSIAVVGVVGLIAYGYLPSQRAGEPKKSEGNPRGTALASGSSVKNTRGKVALKPSPATAKAPVATPAAVVAKTATVPVKVATKSVPAPVAPKVVRAAAISVPKAVKPEPEPTPQPRREKPQPSVVRSTPAAVAVVSKPRPEPKAVVTKPAAKPAVKPAPSQQLPKASRPNSENIESDGTNPLGLPQ